nr:hypothetical protein CFP56_22416 [Quercus suber]
MVYLDGKLFSMVSIDRSIIHRYLSDGKCVDKDIFPGVVPTTISSIRGGLYASPRECRSSSWRCQPPFQRYTSQRDVPPALEPPHSTPHWHKSLALVISPIPPVCSMCFTSIRIYLRWDDLSAKFHSMTHFAPMTKTERFVRPPKIYLGPCKTGLGRALETQTASGINASGFKKG